MSDINVGTKKYKEPRQTIKVMAPLSFKDLNMKGPFLKIMTWLALPVRPNRISEQWSRWRFWQP